MALLIGNQRYSDCPKLNNLKCIEDEVRQVAEKLRQLDFKVSRTHTTQSLNCV